MLAGGVVFTEDDSKAYRDGSGRVAPQITVPSLKLRFSVMEAEQFAKALLAACAAAEQANK